jgi:N-succinyldiaminopimelate aminotransferase
MLFAVSDHRRSTDPAVSRWPHLTARMQGFATETIFAEMSALAVATRSINLGQGFPDTDGPEEVMEAAVAAIRAGHNQYPPGPGIPELREAIARHQHEWYGLDYDPGSEVLVTAGATEAVASALLALCEIGDEVVMFEPYYDSYAACTALAGAARRVVQLHPPAGRTGAKGEGGSAAAWWFDPDALTAAITPRTRLVLVNSPNNPTGKVFSRDELSLIASLCVEHDLLAVTDEVYEHLVFDGEHIPLATFDGMAERTVTISSAGKTFSVTGWKVGWACAPAPLIGALRAVKQFLTYVNGAPFQHAVAAGLRLPAERIAGFADDLRARRDLLCGGLDKLGLEVYPPEGTFFATTEIGERASDGMAFCRSLPEACRVVAVPHSVFYDDREAGRSLVRWTFCKRREVLEEALRRLEKLPAVPGPRVWHVDPAGTAE